MKITGMKSTAFNAQTTVLHPLVKGSIQSNTTGNSQVYFKGIKNIPKHFWMGFRNLSDYMKEPGEMINAIIQMFGTLIIAPIAIMCSPKKKCKCSKCTPVSQNENPEQIAKKDKEKKLFQALRQPVSAALAFGFQVPTTLGIAKILNYYTYQNPLECFKNKEIGVIIPDKKYLRRQAEKALNQNAKPQLVQAWQQELANVQNRDALRAEFMDKIRKDYQEVGIELSDDKLQKMAANKKKFTKFIAEKMAAAKQDRLLAEKVDILSKTKQTIRDIELVTEDYKNLAKEKFAKEIKAMYEKANLTWFDKFLQLMGISNKKLKNLADREGAFAKGKGLILMKQDMPEVFSNTTQKLKKYAENANFKAQKIHSNKIFWITLATNMVMFAVSCVALNWLHPKFATLIDKIRGKKTDDASSKPKVQVRA